MKSDSITIKIATREQAGEISSLVNSAYRGTAGVHGWTHEADLIAGPRVDETSLLVHASKATILIASAAGKVVGCVSVEGLDEDEWYLSMLAIDPQYQELGLGKAVMLEAEKHAQAHGAKTVRISVVNKRVSLIAWYERRGYVQAGRNEGFPYGDPSVGVPLHADLELVVLRKKIA